MRRKRGKPPAPPIRLSPCPFCGKRAGKLSTWRERDDEPLVFVVDCDACHANGPVMGGNASRAKVAWNHRGGPSEMFTAENRGVPEAIYGSETEEERHEREEAGLNPARRLRKTPPCPWCGSDEIFVEGNHVKTQQGKRVEEYHYCFCGTCEAVGPVDESSEGFAILAWGNRIKPPAR